MVFTLHLALAHSLKISKTEYLKTYFRFRILLDLITILFLFPFERTVLLAASPAALRINCITLPDDIDLTHTHAPLGMYYCHFTLLFFSSWFDLSEKVCVPELTSQKI